MLWLIHTWIMKRLLCFTIFIINMYKLCLYYVVKVDTFFYISLGVIVLLYIKVGHLVVLLINNYVNYI